MTSITANSPAADRSTDKALPGAKRKTGRILCRVLAVLALLAPLHLSLSVWQPLRAQTIETAAREAYVVDAVTGTVLLNKNGETPMPPASMSKIMTTYMVFDRIAQGRLSLDDELPVSEAAWSKQGSKMFVELGSKIRVEDLLRGIIVQSGNDACIVIAEGLSGSEAAFAEEMNDKAGEIGLTGSHFANSTGWPDPNHYMTAKDLATLALRVINDHPEFYKIYSEREFTWHGIKQGNRNPLLYKDRSADGLKTGHTEEAGYGLTASAIRQGRRLVVVINGLESIKQRSEEATRLMEWGFREFDNYDIFAAGEEVDFAPVWLGQAEQVPLVAPRDLVVTLLRNQKREAKIKVIHAKAVPAPIAAGQEIAELVVESGGLEVMRVPLLAGAAVPELGPLGRIVASIKHLVLGSD
jgi:D-alanyl-D-alanine carboxypeptidase (penicillin-binding protein 5/6)